MTLLVDEMRDMKRGLTSLHQEFTDLRFVFSPLTIVFLFLFLFLAFFLTRARPNCRKKHELMEKEHASRPTSPAVAPGFYPLPEHFQVSSFLWRAPKHHYALRCVALRCVALLAILLRPTHCRLTQDKYSDLFVQLPFLSRYPLFAGAPPFVGDDTRYACPLSTPLPPNPLFALHGATPPNPPAN